MMTPEGLRNLTDEFFGGPFGDGIFREAFLAAADAWEADRAQATVVLRAYNLARTEILNLRDRIKEVEKELQELKDAIDGKTHLRDASRAAEEEP